MFDRWFQYYAAFSVSLCILSSSMHSAWPSAAIPKLLSGTSTLKINSNEASWLAVIKTVGSIFGAIMGLLVLDYVGRIKPMYISIIFHIAVWLSIAFGTHIAILLGARFLGGFLDAMGFIAMPMYIGEIADPGIRGLLITTTGVFVVLGLLISNAIGLYVTVQNAALISLAFPILAIVISFGLPESPYFLIMKGDKQKALKSLKAFKKEDMVQDEYDRLKYVIDEDLKRRGNFMTLFRVSYIRKTLMKLVILRCFLPLVGLAALTFYTDAIFEEMKGPISAKVWVIIYYVVKLLMTFISGVIMDKTGRIPLLICSTIGITISLFGIGIFAVLEQEGLVNHQDFSYIPILAMFVYIITYSIGLGPISILMLGELMPTSVKSYALCVVDICFCIVEIATSHIFHVTNEHFGLGVPFVIFGIFAILSIIFVVFFVPETKGKLLEDIQEDLKRTES